MRVASLFAVKLFFEGYDFPSKVTVVYRQHGFYLVVLLGDDKATELPPDSVVGLVLEERDLCDFEPAEVILHSYFD